MRRHAETAIAHLSSTDPIMKQMIGDVGPFTLRLERDRFGMLVKSIISQQISTGAARSIRARLEELVAGDGLTAENLVRFTPRQLRTAGVSPQKAKYILDLAENVNSGEVELSQMGRYSDQRVIDQLTKVKGIGTWTAQMFLIFALGRRDVFPHDDLGVRAAIRNHYGLDELPDRETSHAIAENWRPFASFASWYCWRSLDLRRSSKASQRD